MSPRETIMIVDDDPFMRTLITSRLEKAGYPVTTAADAGEALNQAAAIRPRLIISDMLMPVWGGGGEMYAELRKHPRLQEVPVIFVTGMDPNKIKESYPTLFTDPKVRMIGKPINWLMVEQAIFELIGESKPLPKE